MHPKQEVKYWINYYYHEFTKPKNGILANVL